MSLTSVDVVSSVPGERHVVVVQRHHGVGRIGAVVVTVIRRLTHITGAVDVGWQHRQADAVVGGVESRQEAVQEPVAHVGHLVVVGHGAGAVDHEFDVERQLVAR